MRLLNTETFALEVFADPRALGVPYAILSHTWAKDEVSYEDMLDLRRASTKQGFSKIEGACQMAISHSLQYIWVDTCCINKSSSAELSEAINSMFGWYRDATMCYVYFNDLATDGRKGATDEFQGCRWFTRGWCLQELLAPSEVIFFDTNWNLVGTKAALSDLLEDITGIERYVLTGGVPLWTIPLARRMSWAARRQTTRIEDMAYCLLGIFNVNMPMIYGEGPRAFARLQEEILKNTTDLSLLAWQGDKSDLYRGALAASPSEFIGCGDVVFSEDQFRFRDEIVKTNKGIKLSTPLEYVGDNTYILDLHCYRVSSTGTEERLGIYLRRALDTYIRDQPQNLATTGSSIGSLPRILYLASDPDVAKITSQIHNDRDQRICFYLPRASRQYRFENLTAVPNAFWNPIDRCFLIHHLHRFKCFIRFTVISRASSWNADYGSVKEESTQFILVCDMVDKAKLRLTLIAEAGFRSSPKPDGLIDPFSNLAQYPPLGDPFSLSALSPIGDEDRRVSMMHQDHRHNYTIMASVAAGSSAPFNVNITAESTENGNVMGRPHMPQYFVNPHQRDEDRVELSYALPPGRIG